MAGATLSNCDLRQGGCLTGEADGAWMSGFEALSRRMRPALRQFFLRRTGSEADSDELVQELFLRLLRRSDLLSLESTEAYVFQAAANLLRDRARRLEARASGRHDALIDEKVSEPAPSAEDALDARQRLAALIGRLKRLPERTRTVLILRRFEDLSHSEIAERLSISVSAVEKHMARALAALRAEP